MYVQDHTVCIHCKYFATFNSECNILVSKRVFWSIAELKAPCGFQIMLEVHMEALKMP